MADIITFPPNKAPTPEEAAKRKIEAQAHHAERARRLRNALVERPTMQGDQIIVAQALHGLLERVEQRHGVRKKEVLREAGIGSKEDSTKHLSQYAIPQDLPPEELDRRSKRLRKNVRPYLAIAKAAAKLAALDEDEVLLEVFGRADSWARAGAREPAPEFEKLAERLRFVAAGIARKYELTAFFRDVEKAGVAPIPCWECVYKERDTGRPIAMEEIEIEFFNWPQAWPIEFDQPTWEAETEEGARLPAYPSVVLGTWQLGSPFPVSVSAEVTPAGGGGRISGAVQGQYTVELRLCIAPIGKERLATPALRVHLAATLSPLSLPTPTGQEDQTSGGAGETASPDGRPILLFPNEGWRPLKSGRSTISGRSVATEQDIACEISIERDAIPGLFKRYFGDIDPLISERSYSSPGVRFLPITGAVCEDWFGFRREENKYHTAERPLAERALGYALCDVLRLEFYYTVFQSDTLACELDLRLCDPSGGLDRLLEGQAKRLRDAFDEARDSAQEQLKAGWACVQRRWMSPSPAADE